ncbi:hypothetical protein [Candidatus Alkanophaga liquidiphilum]
MNKKSVTLFSGSKGSTGAGWVSSLATRGRERVRDADPLGEFGEFRTFVTAGAAFRTHIQNRAEWS